MRNTARSLAFALALLPGLAAAQTPNYPQTVPANTVVGRLGAGIPGPTQAIPFDTLISQLTKASGLVRAPATATPGNAAIFGASPWLIVDGGAPLTALRRIDTTAPLTGGGDLSANRTFALSIGVGITTCSSQLCLAVPSATTLGGVQSYAAVSHQWINTISTSGVPASSQPTCSDLNGAAASCGTDATNASNIASGTLPAARLPNPSASTLGGIQSKAAVTSNWINSISTSGVPSVSQPSFSDLLGSITTAQCVAATGSAVGCVKPDGSTITISGGIITAVGGVATSVQPGTTTVTGGTLNDCLGTGSSSIMNQILCADLTKANQVLSGGATVTPNNLTAATSFTVNCGVSPLQWILNTGAFTITPPTAANSQSCIVRIINGTTAGNAGAVTLAAGFSGKSPGGATFAATATVSAASISFTNSSATIGWTANTPTLNSIVFFATTGGLPTNFATATPYYVVASTPSTSIQVSATPGGSAITAGSAGTGTQTGYVPSIFDLVVENINSPPYAQWVQVQ